MGKVSRVFLVTVFFAYTLFGAGCATAPKIDKDRANLHHQLGLSGIAQRDFTGALSELLLAAKLNPTDAEIQHALGLAYHGKGRADEAIAAYKKAIEQKPGFSAAYNNMGTVYLALRRYDEARDAFHSALENILYPNPENAYLNLGLLAAEQDQHEEALLLYTRAKKAAPRFCSAYYFAAKSHQKLKQINTAIENIRLAIKFCPDFADAYRYGGILWMMKKKRDVAAQYFTKAYELEPESEIGREAKRYLKLLQSKKGSTSKK